MNHLLQVLNSNVMVAPDKKKPEPTQLETIRGADKGTGGLKAFP